MKRRFFVAFTAVLLCMAMLFASCADKPAENGETTQNMGEGGSDIAVESTSIPETKPAPKYSADDKLIALTFDDGPNNKTTGRILDILEKNGSVATFFVVGYNIENGISTIKRAEKMGCEIGNHSKDHKNLTKCSNSTIASQVGGPNRMLKELADIDVEVFRAPGGSFEGVEKIIGMPIIQWSIDTLDWKHKDAANKGRSEAQRNKDLRKIADKVVNNAEKGDIVLMHDIYEFTADLCEIVIPELVAKGFKLVTVSEMYEAYGIELENAKVYYSVDVIPADTKPLTAGLYVVKTNGGVLNIRNEADKASESVAKIPNGTAVTVLKSIAGWAYVDYNGTMGWVNAAYLAKP